MSETQDTGPIPRTTEHRGYTITLTDSYYFMVAWDADDAMSKHYESMGAARQAIDEMLVKKEKAARLTQRLKTSVPVLLPGGVEAVVTGIHASRGTILTKPPSDSYALYPRVAWIQHLLAEQATLNRRLKDIDSDLRRYSLTTSNYGSRGRDIEDQMAQFQAKLDEAATKAKAVEQPPQPKYT